MSTITEWHQIRAKLLELGASRRWLRELSLEDKHDIVEHHHAAKVPSLGTMVPHALQTGMLDHRDNNVIPLKQPEDPFLDCAGGWTEMVKESEVADPTLDEVKEVLQIMSARAGLVVHGIIHGVLSNLGKGQPDERVFLAGLKLVAGFDSFDPLEAPEARHLHTLLLAGVFLTEGYATREEDGDVRRQVMKDSKLLHLVIKRIDAELEGG